MIRVALLGRPVAHSRSPAMMRAAFEALGIEGAYVPCEVAPEGLGDAVRGLAALGFDGANVTVPHKVSVMDHLARADAAARLVGAANALSREGAGFAGYNTDADGLVETLRAMGADPRGADVAVLGAGGAARAAVVGVALAGARSVAVVARRVASARPLVEAAAYASHGCVAHAHELGRSSVPSALAAASLVIQATSCGMAGGPPADELLAGADLSRCAPGSAAMDLVYAPPVTDWMRAAERAGLWVLHGAGREVLVRQGAAALARWTGREAPLDAMRRALAV